MKKFNPNTKELEDKLNNLFPVLDLVKGYTEIARRVNDDGGVITGQQVYKMFHKHIISDHYVCRLVIHHSKQFVEEINTAIQLYKKP